MRIPASNAFAVRTAGAACTFSAAPGSFAAWAWWRGCQERLHCVRLPKPGVPDAGTIRVGAMCMRAFASGAAQDAQNAERTAPHAQCRECVASHGELAQNGAARHEEHSRGTVGSCFTVYARALTFALSLRRRLVLVQPCRVWRQALAPRDDRRGRRVHTVARAARRAARRIYPPRALPVPVPRPRLAPSRAVVKDLLRNTMSSGPRRAVRRIDKTAAMA